MLFLTDVFFSLNPQLNSQNSIKPLRKKEQNNNRHSAKIRNSNRNSASSIQQHEANIFVEEPEVFEIPAPPRKRRMPTPDSPLEKQYDTFETSQFRAGEKEPSPPPRPPKGQQLLRKMRQLPDLHCDDGAVGDQQTSSCSDSQRSSIEITVDMEDDSQKVQQTSSVVRISLEDSATDESSV